MEKCNVNLRWDYNCYINIVTIGNLWYQNEKGLYIFQLLYYIFYINNLTKMHGGRHQSKKF